MRSDRIEKLETRARETHSLAWAAFWARFRAALDSVPAGMFEGPFKPVELDDLDGLEDALAPWDAWADAALPVLERSQDDLLVWPNDLPPVPGDPSPLLSRVIAQWRKHPGCSVAALVTLLSLAVAAEGEGGSPSPEVR